VCEIELRDHGVEITLQVLERVRGSVRLVRAAPAEEVEEDDSPAAEVGEQSIVQPEIVREAMHEDETGLAPRILSGIDPVGPALSCYASEYGRMDMKRSATFTSTDGIRTSHGLESRGVTYAPDDLEPGTLGILVDRYGDPREDAPEMLAAARAAGWHASLTYSASCWWSPARRDRAGRERRTSRDGQRQRPGRIARAR
jgi:hypothetical protein